MTEVPKAPWSPFPLVELAVLGGLVLIGLAIAGVGDNRPLFFGAGFVLVCLSGVELSLREHFAGFRSHSALLGGAAGVLAMVLTAALLAPVYRNVAGHKLPGEVLPVAGAVVFGLTFWGLRSAFRRRTGGIAFRA